MKINKIKELEVGLGNIHSEGNIVFISELKHMTGTKGGRNYDFWTQFVIVEDDTDSIGVNTSLKNKEGFQKGQKVEVTKATLKSYNDKLSLQGVVTVKETTKTKPPIGKTNGPDKDLQIIRQTAMKVAGKLVASGMIDISQLFPVGQEVVDFVYDGYKESKQEEKTIPKLDDSAPSPIPELASNNQIKAIWAKINNLGSLGLDQEKIECQVRKSAGIEHIKKEYLTKTKAHSIIEWLKEETTKREKYLDDKQQETKGNKEAS